MKRINKIRLLLNNILTDVKNKSIYNVEISNNVNVGTLVVNENHNNNNNCTTPIVLLHGIECLGVASWLLNYNSLNRPVYAIDLMGFGQSTTKTSCIFTNEEEYIACIEIWRRKLNINRMILVGHGFGGYLAILYAMYYSKVIERLILSNVWEMSSNIINKLNDLKIIRLMGPKCGAMLIRKKNKLLLSKLTNNKKKIFSRYFFYCNTQRGEQSVRKIVQKILKDRNETLLKMKNNLNQNLKITFIYTSKTQPRCIQQHISNWYPNLNTTIHYLSEKEDLNNNNSSYVIYAEKFNKIINNQLVSS